MGCYCLLVLWCGFSWAFIIYLFYYALFFVIFSQVVCVGSFSQTLRRYTSLNHLAQAARAVLQNSAQISQMLSDLNRVDFTNVQVCTAVTWLLFSCVNVNVKWRWSPPTHVPHRSRHPGCVSVKTAWSRGWSKTLKLPYSNKSPWSSGLPGWMTLSPRSWSPMSTTLWLYQRLQRCSYSTGLFIGEGKVPCKTAAPAENVEVFYIFSAFSPVQW